MDVVDVIFLSKSRKNALYQAQNVCDKDVYT